MEQAVVQAFSKRGMHGVLYPRRSGEAADQLHSRLTSDQLAFEQNSLDKPRRMFASFEIAAGPCNSECRHDRSYAALPLFFHSFHAARNTLTSAF